MTTNNITRFNAEAAAWDANPDVHRASDGALRALLDVYSSFPQGSSSSSSSSPPSSTPDDNKSPTKIHLTRATSPRARAVDVLELGCGTGLLSLRLAPYVRSLLAVDAAEGMIAALEAKLSSPSSSSSVNNNNITPLCILLQDAEDPRLPPQDDEDDDNPQEESSSTPTTSTIASKTTTTTTSPRRKKFHLVVAHLLLHHVPPAALPSLLRTMRAALRPGGEVALTDYQDVGPDARRFHPEAKMAGVESPRGIDAVAFAALLRDAGFVDVRVGPHWTMEKEVERFPGEWGHDKPTTGDLAKMEFPFLLCRGRRPLDSR